MSENWREDDGITPRCAACDAPINLEGYLKRLNAGQGLLELHRRVIQAGHRPVTLCDACATEPGRLLSYTNAVGRDELRARIRREALLLQDMELEE
jgi:hypothetical protein